MEIEPLTSADRAWARDNYHGSLLQLLFTARKEYQDHILNYQKKEFINEEGNDVTTAFKNYARPLIGSLPICDRISAPVVEKILKIKSDGPSEQ